MRDRMAVGAAEGKGAASLVDASGDEVSVLDRSAVRR
jgi:hypothetical protein